MQIFTLNNFLFRSSPPLILAAILCGCAATKSLKVVDHTVPIIQTTEPYSMAALDEAQITLKGGDRVVLQINSEGYLEGETRRIKGMPVAVFRSLVAKKYPGALAIEIKEFRPNRVTVLGEVFHQIHTDLGDGPMRVMDAIAAANGFTPLANKRRVKLLRQNAGIIEVYELDLREMLLGQDLSQNLLLKPGDVITVPKNFL